MEEDNYGVWYFLSQEEWKAFLYTMHGLNMYSEGEEPITTPVPEVYLKAFEGSTT